MEGTMEAPEDTIVVYSDYVCPFCYLGKASLETYMDGVEDAPKVQWRPFDLRLHQRTDGREIDASISTGKTKAYYEQAKKNVERLKDEYGVEMAQTLPRDVDSWNAHKASLHVQRTYDEEAFQRFHEAVFDALWVHEEDIGRPDVLVDIGEQIGIETEDLLEALEDDALDDELHEAFRASHREGVTGVPTFVYNDLRIPGAVPPEHIRKLIENG